MNPEVARRMRTTPWKLLSAATYLAATRAQVGQHHAHCTSTSSTTAGVVKVCVCARRLGRWLAR